MPNDVGVLDKLREFHHAPARLLARGYTVEAAAIYLKRSVESIEDLTNDPTFKGLVQHYRNRNKENGSVG